MQWVECEGQFEGRRKWKPLLIHLNILLRGKWRPKERERDTPLRNFPASNHGMKYKVFQYQHWKDSFVSMSPERGDSLQSPEKNILESKYPLLFLSFLLDIFLDSLYWVPRLGQRRGRCWCFYDLGWYLALIVGAERANGTYGTKSPEHSSFAWALRIMNSNPSSEGKRTKSLLKLRQFLIIPTLVFLPETLSSGFVPCNFSMPGRRQTLAERKYKLWLSWCMGRGRE